MGSKEDTPLDFKYTNWKDTYIVEGTRYRADEFGNFVAGWVGEHAGGGVGVLGSMIGGILFDWGDPCSKNPRWNPDADSREDILAGAGYARKINFFRNVNKMFGR
jgi:hypothetical protein